MLKCYPRTTKGAVDVKPNSSELSYLLFYATSRRSKIQKVGSFLEKKTATDVWRMHIGNVQVTLQILAALIEKAPKDMPLFAPYVLKILDLVLRSDDITMVESSLPTFAIFCENHDASSLQADQDYIQQYESIVRAYAALASTRRSPGKVPITKPVAMRWRNTGLKAIKSLASSDSLSSISSLQLDVIVPMILENLWTNNEGFLDVLLKRAQLKEEVECDKPIRRRTSIATVRTAESAGDTNPIALLGSALDVDKLAEEDIGVLAMKCLEQVFVGPNRPQIHGATAALLKFIEERVSQNEVVVKRHPRTYRDGGWAIKVIDLATRWSPVQDRFIILITVMESMLKLPVSDETLKQHIVLAGMIRSLLRSDINMIGLSVMDVLLGLISQMKKALAITTNHLDKFNQSDHENEKTTTNGTESAQILSSRRNELLERIQECIADLATHIYYIDQVSDMVIAILSRLRPSHSNSTVNSSPSGERVESQPVNTSTSNLVDSQQLEAYLSLTAGKICALHAVKAIILVANSQAKSSANVSLLRNRIPITVWEGSHWMLRDPDSAVRQAYVDALVAWLDHETTVGDLQAWDEGYYPKGNTGKSGKDLAPAAIARRAASGASAWERPAKSRSHFLQLLHVAIYDNALQFIEFDGDIIMLHILLTKLAMRLGVNAIHHSLPMIFRLQEDIQEAETPVAKVRIGSLCHGFFWALTEAFNFEASVVGRAIHNEVVRRRSKGFWVEGIHVPPAPLDKVPLPGVLHSFPRLSMREIESEALLPFDDRFSLIECIATGYLEQSTSPPTSPVSSPGRRFSNTAVTNVGVAPMIDANKEIPGKMRDEMLDFDWSRETVISAIQEGSKSASLNGSRSGTMALTNRNLLNINGGATSGHSPAFPSSPVHSAHGRPTSGHDQTSPTARRKASMQSAISVSPGSASSRGFVTTVEQLKLVLASGQIPSVSLPPAAAGDDTGSESMASYDGTPSELSFNPGKMDRGNVDTGALARSGTISTRKTSFGEGSGQPVFNHSYKQGFLAQGEDESNIPPVLAVPANLFPGRPTTAPSSPRIGHTPVSSLKQYKRSIKSRGGDSITSRKTHFDAPPPSAMDLQMLLLGIDSHAGESTLSNISRPPY